jgi:hypothetical protein
MKRLEDCSSSNPTDSLYTRPATQAALGYATRSIAGDLVLTKSNDDDDSIGTEAG